MGRMLPDGQSSRRRPRRIRARLVGVLAGVAFAGGVLISLPPLLALQVERQGREAAAVEPFPVSVDPRNKLIVENPAANAFFEETHPLAAAIGDVRNVVLMLFEEAALAVAAAPWYQNLAAADSVRFVAVAPGMRKEQVAGAFGKALGWNDRQKKAFLARAIGSSLPLPEGSFAPHTYAVPPDTTPEAAQALVNERFTKDVLSRYSAETEKRVPLEEALTIASLIEREAGGRDDMRVIAGIIWNRLFRDMNLQIDATIQYARANAAASGAWWPAARPVDINRKSPYNTYLNRGLPPTPIANPSVAAIVAALNPKSTTCLFYFHDAAKRFHCSDTYAEHVALLKQYYGRGK